MMPLGSQKCGTAILSVCKAHKAQKTLGRIHRGELVPAIRFNRASGHFTQRTYSIGGEQVSLSTLDGCIKFPCALANTRSASWPLVSPRRPSWYDS